MVNKKIALIIGGTGGIGRYLVEAFVKAEYQVVFTYCSSKEKADGIAKEYQAVAFKADTSDEADIVALKDMLAEEYGRLDALIYGTGIFEDALIGDMELESWNRVVATNLTGAFLCAKYMVPLLRVCGQGRYIGIGSVIGESGIYGSCSYAASKAGLIGLIKSIALENAKYGVTANVVSLGYIDTGMTARLSEKVLDSAIKKVPMKKLGQPQDAARVVVDLCADHTNYISGQVIRLNGLLYV